jgi:hypothetical protein
LNGVDYGRIDTLPKLTFLETLLISRTTVHLKLVKLSWTCPSQMAIKGHCVCVPHDGADATENTLPRNIDDVLCVKYFGPPEHMQAMKSRFKSLPQFQVSMEKIEAWIRVFKAIHTDYAFVAFNRHNFPNLDAVFCEGDDTEKEMETNSGDQNSDCSDYVLLDNQIQTNSAEENVEQYFQNAKKTSLKFMKKNEF